jgi:hypothetical protein
MRRAEVVEVLDSVLNPHSRVTPGSSAVRVSQASMPEDVLNAVRQKRSLIPSLRRRAAQEDYEFIVEELLGFEQLAELSLLREVLVVSKELGDAARRGDRDAVEMWLDRLNEALKNAERLVIVRASGLLDSPQEEEFDRLTRLASAVLRVPMALITVVDEDRQFLKSAVGMNEPWASSRETPISHSFCQHVTSRVEELVVDDARDHPLVRDSPAITEMSIIAYAGMPLMTDEGVALGSFCAIDNKPRHWSEADLAMLRDFAHLTVKQWERRRIEGAIGNDSPAVI